jgi:hypothetical protein
MRTVYIFLAVTLLVCGLTFAQQTSTNQPTSDYHSSSSKADQQSKYDATTGKKFVGKIVSIDHDSKSLTVAAIETKPGSGSTSTGSSMNQGTSTMNQGTDSMSQGTRTFKYNDHTKYHRDGGNDKDFSINNLDKGDDVLVQYDNGDIAILISKLPPSEKAK